MEYIVESSLENFQAWSGGKDTLDTLKEEGDVDEVERLIEGSFCGHTTTDTEINDFLWFERDMIAEHLGYKDWEAYEEGWSLEDLKEADDWFHALDEEELSKVYRERDEDEDEDDFVYDAADWWDDLDDEKKVDIYYKNN